MSERPIIFSDDMVRAILDGRKAQTRRMVTAQNSTVLGYRVGQNDPMWQCLDWGRVRIDRGPHWFHSEASEYLHVGCTDTAISEKSQFFRVRSRFKIGDRLWVREAHKGSLLGGAPFIDYRATIEQDDPCKYPITDDQYRSIESRHGKWRPSIHMPRWASRITLEVTGVKVERLQNISREDVSAEGVQIASTEEPDFIAAYADMWDSIYAEHGNGWFKNPWVWVIEFRRV